MIEYPGEHLQIINCKNSLFLIKFDLFVLDQYGSDESYTDLRSRIHKYYIEAKQIDKAGDLKNVMDGFAVAEKAYRGKEKNAKYAEGVDNFLPYLVGREKAGWLEYFDLYPLREITFEEMKCYGPNNVKSFLKCCYGDNYLSFPKDVGIQKHGGYFQKTKNVLVFFKREDLEDLLKKPDKILKLYAELEEIGMLVITVADNQRVRRFCVTNDLEAITANDWQDLKDTTFLLLQRTGIDIMLFKNECSQDFFLWTNTREALNFLHEES